MINVKNKSDIVKINTVVEDLKSKVNKAGYFNTKIFKKDKKIYERRSFGDLFKYYKNFGITEKILIKSLKKANFVMYVCVKLQKGVFFKYVYAGEFLNDLLHGDIHSYGSFNQIKNDKYTKEYLEKLLNS